MELLTIATISTILAIFNGFFAIYWMRQCTALKKEIDLKDSIVLEHLEILEEEMEKDKCRTTQR